MYCPECEQLFDAYLDGQLAGTLRLEFDAHRLRCQRCQQTLAMLEAAGHVIASDTHAPDLPPDFADRVMREIAHPPVRALRFPSTRVALVTAALAQVAAVLAFVIVWRSGPAPVMPAAPGGEPAVVRAERAEKPDSEAILRLITEGVEDRLWEMYAVGAKLPADVANLARYLDIKVPADVVRESVKMVGINPLQFLLDFSGKGEQEEPEPALPANEVHSI